MLLTFVSGVGLLATATVCYSQSTQHITPAFHSHVDHTLHTLEVGIARSHVFHKDQPVPDSETC